jgi:hypothetical protein
MTSAEALAAVLETPSDQWSRLAHTANRALAVWCRSFRNAFVFRSEMLAESFAESWRNIRSSDKSARVEVLQ